MLFFFYLNELKYRFFYCILFFILNFILLLLFSKEILFILVKPLLIINKNNFDFSYFIFTDMTDIFFIYIKISFIISLVCTLPIVLIHIYFFLVQGLYNYEKKFLFYLFLFIIFLFFNFIFYLYIFIIPFIWIFFINFELTSSDFLFGVYYEPQIKDYISFYIQVNKNIVFSLLFLPVLLFILIFFNLNFIYNFFRYRKLVIIFIFTIGGLFSPPDVFSQIIIALLLLFLYEFILFGALIHDIYLKEYFNKS